MPRRLTYFKIMGAGKMKSWQPISILLKILCSGRVCRFGCISHAVKPCRQTLGFSLDNQILLLFEPLQFSLLLWIKISMYFTMRYQVFYLLWGWNCRDDIWELLLIRLPSITSSAWPLTSTASTVPLSDMGHFWGSSRSMETRHL